MGWAKSPPLGETMLTTCSLIKKQIFAISDIIIVTVIIDAISAKGFSAKNTFTLVIRWRYQGKDQHNSHFSWDIWLLRGFYFDQPVRFFNFNFSKKKITRNSRFWLLLHFSNTGSSNTMVLALLLTRGSLVPKDSNRLWLVDFIVSTFL